MKKLPEKTLAEGEVTGRVHRVDVDVFDLEDGEDWYQQGDVCIWPREAKSLKEFPSVLT